MDPVVELLDRQTEFILGLDEGPDFLAQVGPFLQALHSEPRLAVHLQDLESELVDDVRALQGVDDDLTPQLIQLRDELVGLVPELDDSDAELPKSGVLDISAEYTLAYFDWFVAQPAEHMNVAGEGGKATTLLGILQGKDVHHIQEQRQARQAAAASVAGVETEASADEDDSDADDPEELRQWRWRLGNIDQKLTHAKRWLALRMRTSAGLAYARLTQVPGQLNPEPYLITSRQDLLDRLNAGLKQFGSPAPSLYKAVHGERVDATDASVVEQHINEARRWVRRLHQELRHRIGTTRSRRALVDRFKLRCEWHDRERLAGVADDESLPGGPEDRLTGELARYLFDAGLSPLTKPMTGGLQPDLLDPQRPAFYVEAKQYAGSSARGEVVKSVAQVLDTVGRLQGGPYAVDEAFVIVFRRGGPRYVLPTTLEADGYRVHLVFVDVAPPDESGARQQEKPVVLTPEEFFAAAEEAEAHS